MHIRELVWGVFTSAMEHARVLCVGDGWGSLSSALPLSHPVSRAPDESESCQGEPREATPGQQACRLECTQGQPWTTALFFV